MTKMQKHTIDTLNLQEDLNSKKLLVALLSQHPELLIIEAGQEYPTIVDDQLLNLTTAHTLIARKSTSKKHLGASRWQLFHSKKVVAGGSTSDLYRSDIVIKLTDGDHLAISQTHHRVIKDIYKIPDLTRDQREYKILNEIYGCKGLIQFNSHSYLIMPNYGETLSHHIYAGNIDSLEMLVVAKKSADALLQIQTHGYVHADIKPENILYDRKTGRVTIVDFGFAFPINEQDSHGGAHYYLAPEYLTGRVLSSDVYSLGVVLTQWFSNMTCTTCQLKTFYETVIPFLKQSNMTLEDYFLTSCGEYTREVSSSLISMLHYDPTLRATIKSIIENFSIITLRYLATKYSTPEIINFIIDYKSLLPQLSVAVDVIYLLEQHDLLFSRLGKLTDILLNKCSQEEVSHLHQEIIRIVEHDENIEPIINDFLHSKDSQNNLCNQ